MSGVTLRQPRDVGWRWVALAPLLLVMAGVLYAGADRARADFAARKKVAYATADQMAKMLPQYEQFYGTMGMLSEMAPTNAAAADIVQRYGIRFSKVPLTQPKTP